MIRLVALHDRLFAALERAAEPWLLGLLARLVFAAVLFGYYWNSALTKVGEGLAGFFSIQPGAYFQIVPPVIEAAGYDPSAVAFLPWGLIVVLGAYSEFLLPVLIVAGLATRLAALGMIGFILVQSYVDVAFHGADATTLGALFDRIPNAAILDQRTLWVFPLIYLVVKGAGLLSLDALLARRVAAATGPRAAAAGAALLAAALLAPAGVEAVTTEGAGRIAQEKQADDAARPAKAAATAASGPTSGSPIRGVASRGDRIAGVSRNRAAIRATRLRRAAMIEAPSAFR